MSVLKMDGLFCDSCKKVHLNPSQEEKALAKRWGFFLCGMAGKSHADENFVRTTVIYNGVRRNLFSGEEVEL